MNDDPKATVEHETETGREVRDRLGPHQPPGSVSRPLPPPAQAQVPVNVPQPPKPAEHRKDAEGKEEEIPVNFATMHHALLSRGKVPFPQAVEKWADEHPSNRHLFEELKRGAEYWPDDRSMKLLDELLKMVRGKDK
jgi:hypothetical protein